MDPRLIKTAKEIPERLKDVMNHMFEQSEPALRSGVSALRQSLIRLEQYLGTVEREHLGSTTAGNPAANSAAAGGRRVRRRRGGRFAITEYLLKQMASNPKGLRPFELSALLATDTGRDKKSAVANVNTALSRMRKQGLCVSRNGVYFASAARPATAAAAGSPAGKGAVVQKKTVTPKKTGR